MRLRRLLAGAYRQLLLPADDEPDPIDPDLPRCEVLEVLRNNVKESQLDKLLPKIQYGLDSPNGLVDCVGDPHISHKAHVAGRDVKFWGIDVGKLRLYCFEDRGGLVIATLVIMKKSKKTPKSAQTQMEACCARYFAAVDAREPIEIA